MTIKRTTGLIYRATSMITGKCYIGYTVQPLVRRQKQHYRNARTIGAGGYRCHFYDAIRKYGEDLWVWEVLIDNIPIERLGLEEVLAVYIYNSYYEGYNSTLGGEKGTFGRKCSEETRRKIAKAHLGRKQSEAQRKDQSKRNSGAGNPMHGKSAMKGKHYPKEVTDIWRGPNNHNYGKHLSAETKEKISKARKGKKNPEHSKRMIGENNPMYGKKRSAESIEKVRKSNTGRKHTEESKKKMSDARKKAIASKKTKNDRSL
jgi:group I intron endonuclease